MHLIDEEKKPITVDGYYSPKTFHVPGVTLSLLPALIYLLLSIIPKGKFYYMLQFPDTEPKMQGGKVMCLRTHRMRSSRPRAPVLKSSGVFRYLTWSHPEKPLAFPSLSYPLILHLVTCKQNDRV